METYELYGGEITLTFDPVKHVYCANGDKVEGATTILKVINKPALINWSAKMAAEYVGNNLKPGVSLDEVEIVGLCEGAKAAHRVKRDNSASLGHMAHAWFEDYFLRRNPPTPVNPELREMTKAFLMLTETHNIKPLEVERRLYSREHRFAGTTDLICEVDGKLTIADYKTSASGIYPEHFIQLGAYGLCYEEETFQQAEQHMIINCNAKGELWVAISTETQRNMSAFTAALNLSRALKAATEELKAVKTQIKF